MEKRINRSGEFYLADFGYFSMGIYTEERAMKLLNHS